MEGTNSNGQMGLGKILRSCAFCPGTSAVSTILCESLRLPSAAIQLKACISKISENQRKIHSQACRYSQRPLVHPASCCLLWRPSLRLSPHCCFLVPRLGPLTSVVCVSHPFEDLGEDKGTISDALELRKCKGDEHKWERVTGPHLNPITINQPSACPVLGHIYVRGIPRHFRARRLQPLF